MSAIDKWEQCHDYDMLTDLEVIEILDGCAAELASLRAENEMLRVSEADYVAQLRAENDELRLALKVSIVCNAEQKSWGEESPFQKRLDGLVGKFEHEKVNRDDIAEGYCSYCETPLADVAAAREHGKICEKHPLRAELENADENLLSMVSQYCYRPHSVEHYSHDFMSAGEGAFEYLVNRGLAEWCDNGVDIRNLKFPSAHPAQREEK